MLVEGSCQKMCPWMYLCLQQGSFFSSKTFSLSLCYTDDMMIVNAAVFLLFTFCQIPLHHKDPCHSGSHDPCQESHSVGCENHRCSRLPEATCCDPLPRRKHADTNKNTHKHVTSRHMLYIHRIKPASIMAHMVSSFFLSSLLSSFKTNAAAFMCLVFILTGIFDWAMSWSRSSGVGGTQCAVLVVLCCFMYWHFFTVIYGMCRKVGLFSYNQQNLQ